MKTLKSFALLAALAVTGFLTANPAAAADYEPVVGLQTWTCRNMSFEQMVDFAVKHHIKYIQAISKHMDPNDTPDDRLAASLAAATLAAAQGAAILRVHDVAATRRAVAIADAVNHAAGRTR